MARNSKRPINFSDGVTAQVNGRLVTFIGKKGSMDLNVHSEVNVETNEEFILFSPANESKESVTLTSTMRSLAKNIIEGVSEGFEKKLEINGVGYRVKVNGNKVELSLGLFSSNKLWTTGRYNSWISFTNRISSKFFR